MGVRRSWRVGMVCKTIAVRLSRFDSYRTHRDLHSGCNVDYLRRTTVSEAI